MSDVRIYVHQLFFFSTHGGNQRALWSPQLNEETPRKKKHRIDDYYFSPSSTCVIIMVCVSRYFRPIHQPQIYIWMCSLFLFSSSKSKSVRVFVSLSSTRGGQGGRVHISKKSQRFCLDLFVFSISTFQMSWERRTHWWRLLGKKKEKIPRTRQLTLRGRPRKKLNKITVYISSCKCSAPIPVMNISMPSLKPNTKY